jgi:ribosomal protein L11 methyltransferase
MVELVLLARAEQVDLLSDALTDELDALAVTVEDADADTPDEAPIFGEPGMPATLSSQIGGWKRSIVKALFADEDSATEAATLLLAQDDGEDGAAPAPLFEDLHVQGLQPVADEDWVRLTQSQFEPVLITSDFWIVPSWHKAPEGATRVMRLDPGLAFGTGTHPTTRMCLRWIARHADAARPWPRVLDYGCGSGILAIGAALHGAQAIDAVDIDPAAVDSTRANAAANGVTLDRVGLPDRADGLYPVVLANILAAPLKLLAPLLSAHVAPGGSLVMAGLLERQIEDLQAAYAPWLELEVADREEGWVLLTARRP